MASRKANTTLVEGFGRSHKMGGETVLAAILHRRCGSAVVIFQQSVTLKFHLSGGSPGPAAARVQRAC